MPESPDTSRRRSPGTFALVALAVTFLAVAGAGEPPAPRADCNSNGVDDAADIALGTSADANANGVPDECELPLARIRARLAR